MGRLKLTGGHGWERGRARSKASGCCAAGATLPDPRCGHGERLAGPGLGQGLGQLIIRQRKQPGLEAGGRPGCMAPAGAAGQVGERWVEAGAAGSAGGAGKGGLALCTSARPLSVHHSSTAAFIGHCFQPLEARVPARCLPPILLTCVCVCAPSMRRDLGVMSCPHPIQKSPPHCL